MDKIKEIINKLLGKDSKSSESSGFTLVELLIVIAVIGILAAALLVAIDPIDKVNAGNDTKVINNARNIYDAALRYYANNGTIPTTGEMVSSGELKVYPTAPSNYAAYSYAFNGATAAVSDDISICGQVKSKANRKKLNPTAATIPATAYVYIAGGSLCYRSAACGAAYIAVPAANTPGTVMCY